MMSFSSMMGLSVRLRSGFRVIGFRKGLLLAFVFGFLVRLIPEILSFPHPIGFDTIYYAWRIQKGVVWVNWQSVFSSWWLIFAFLVPLNRVLNIEPFLLLKSTAPLLFGLNTSAVYYFATKALSWSGKKSLLASVLLSFGIAALALSWGSLRNMLGLGILFFALPYIANGVKGIKESLFFVLLSVLVVFSNEFAAAMLFVAVFSIALNYFLKKAKRDLFKVLALTIPALVLLIADMYVMVFSLARVAEANILSAYQGSGQYSGALFLFTNYLTVYDPVQHYPTYFHLLSHVVSLFALLYIVVLPLVLVGVFRDRILSGWSVFLLFGSFGALLVPFFALNMWYRWMLMLVYPFTLYAANGITKISHSANLSADQAFHGLRWLKLSWRSVKLIVTISFVLGLAFMCTPLFFGKAGLFGLPTTANYVPSTMQSNSVPLVDVEGVTEAMQWLDAKMDDRSVLLSQDAFFDWSRLYLDSTHSIVYFTNDVQRAFALAKEHGFSRIYFVWWNEDIGWYGVSVPSHFASVFTADRISVFAYMG